MAADVQGPYRLIERLGGSVWKAHDPRLDKTVAIKILAANAAQHQPRIQAFLWAASAMAELDHPNIIQVYDVGSDRQGCYLTMEFVVGTTLTNHLFNGLGDQSIARVDAQLRLLQEFAESRGITTRRLTADNILIDKNGNIKVTAAAWNGCRRQLSPDAQQ